MLVILPYHCEKLLFCWLCTLWKLFLFTGWYNIYMKTVDIRYILYIRLCILIYYYMTSITEPSWERYKITENDRQLTKHCLILIVWLWNQFLRQSFSAISSHLMLSLYPTLLFSLYHQTLFMFIWSVCLFSLCFFCLSGLCWS